MWGKKMPLHGMKFGSVQGHTNRKKKKEKKKDFVILK